MARRTRGGVKKIKELLGNLSVSGGMAGVLALALAIWVIVYWFVDECSFDSGENCKLPQTPKENENRSDERNVQLIVAFVVIVPTVYFLITSMLGMGN